MHRCAHLHWQAQLRTHPRTHRGTHRGIYRGARAHTHTHMHRHTHACTCAGHGSCSRLLRLCAAAAHGSTGSDFLSLSGSSCVANVLALALSTDAYTVPPGFLPQSAPASHPARNPAVTGFPCARGPVAALGGAEVSMGMALAALAAAPDLCDLGAWCCWAAVFGGALGPLPAFLRAHAAKRGACVVLELSGTYFVPGLVMHAIYARNLLDVDALLCCLCCPLHYITRVLLPWHCHDKSNMECENIEGDNMEGENKER
eukprot:1154028-Pelagomonas_calceolata.AAC.5